MEDIAVETAKSSPKELATLTRADADKWGKIIKQLGITPQWPKFPPPLRPSLSFRHTQGLEQREMAINYRSHFAYRIDAWDADGENVIEHLAGVEDLQVAKATYLAACQRWPGTPITLRQGTRVIEDSRQTRLVWVPLLGAWKNCSALRIIGIIITWQNSGDLARALVRSTRSPHLKTNVAGHLAITTIYGEDIVSCQVESIK
jgi:hypothetical protein